MVGYSGNKSEDRIEEVYDRVDLNSLPKMAELREEVNSVLKRCGWWDLYGVDAVLYFIMFVFVFVALFLMSSPNYWTIGLGVLIYGYCHHAFAVKGGHAAIHKSVCESPKLNRFWSFLFSDVIGTFPSDAGYDIHIKIHHPYTNIIGLGDSSTWKVSFLPAFTYMFVAPLFLPVITLPLSVQELWGKWFMLARYLILAAVGLVINFYLLMQISGFSFFGALMTTWASRAYLSIPYIHVNIFQHIGLPMYSQKSQPKRIYQMSTAVLNLPRNPLLDFSFGHSIVSCHVEHHLFPTLSDNICLKIQPIVSKFLKRNGLPYHKDSYWGRVKDFTYNYEKLMVNAPPITHFVGIQ